MTALPIIVLLALAALGAGLVPGAAPPCAVALLLTACLRPLPLRRSFRCWVWLLVALALWTAATTLPVGSWVGDWRAALSADAEAFLARYGRLCSSSAGASPVGARLSLHPSGSLRWLILLLGAGGMVCVVASLRTRQRIALAKGLALFGGVVAALGIVGRVLIPQGSRLVWWYPVSELGGGNPLGPFVNRNHFAAFCALLAPLALALTCHAAGPVWGEADSLDDAHGDVGLTVSFGERLLFGASVLAMVGGVLVSRSRGGTAALLLGFVVMALLWLRRGPGAAALATLAGVAAIVLVALWPDPEFQGRLHGLRDTSSALGARWPIWLDCGRVWAQVPLAGCGANAFGMIFPRVTNWAAGQQATHAESDVMQVLAEGGAIGALLALGMLLTLGWPLLRVLLRRQRPGHEAAGEGSGVFRDPPGERIPARSPWDALRLPYPLLAAVGGGLTAILFGSAVDIPLRVPLGAWTFAAVAGLAAPPAPRRGHSYLPRAWLCPERAGLVALLAVLLWVGWHAPGWPALYRDRDAWIDLATPADLAALLAETPTYWQAWYELGNQLFHQAGSTTGPEHEALQDAAWQALRSAVRANPRDPRLRAALAGLLWRDGLWQEARAHRDVQIALSPGDQGLRLHWLRAEWQAGFAAEARQLTYRFAEANAADGEAAQYLLWLADRELTEGSVSGARQALLAAAARVPGDTRTMKALAECERRLGNPAQEVAWLRALAEHEQADAAIWWRLAELALANADRDGLQRALGMAVQREPSRRRAADVLWKAFVERQPRAPR